MKNRKLKFVPLLLIAILGVLSTLVGCSEKYEMAPVSGTITLDGKPLAGAQVNFAPQQTVEAGLEGVGPFSSGITDDNGKFSLTNRYGRPGAVVGSHSVSVKVQGAEFEEIYELEDEVEELKQDVEDGDEEAKFELATAQEKLAILQENVSIDAVTIPAKYSLNSELKFTVPEGGTDAANFDLTTDVPKVGGKAEEAD